MSAMAPAGFASTVTRPDLVLCAARGSGVDPFLRSLEAHPDLAFVGAEDFDDAAGDADTFPLNTFDPAYTGAPGCDDAFDAIARRGAGRARHIAWRPGFAIEWPHVLTIAAERLPDARVLFCLRDPVVATHARHSAGGEGMPETLRAAVDASLARMAEAGRYEHRGRWPQLLENPTPLDLLLQSGVYEPAVRRALRRLPAGRVCVVAYEHLPAALDDVAGFLDIDRDGFGPFAAAPPPTIDAEASRALAAWFDPWNRRLFGLLGWPSTTWIRPA